MFKKIAIGGLACVGVFALCGGATLWAIQAVSPDGFETFVTDLAKM